MNNLPKLPWYDIDHLIASGGTANVYWGVDLRSGFPVAIKELKIRHFKNPVIREKFKNVEAQLYLYLQHPNIPKLVDFIDLKETSQMFIVMEFVKGRSLEEYIYREIGLIPEQKALPMFLEILDTVSYIHNKGILHLDLKPNNVMIQPNGKLKLIDLGIASRMKNASTSTSGEGFGTPAYMPPEQAEKGGRVGKYTDIFALGVMLFEMLTGQQPFTSNNPDPRKNIAEIKWNVKNQPTPQMKQYYSHIGNELQFIVERALAKEPSARYQSCREFSDAIKDYMKRKKY
ncbi:MAG: serine/threonine protein kinase [Bacteroidales bacterium]|nr:serine/threonine protein kinase [Bacteroidales bacterium]